MAVKLSGFIPAQEAAYIEALIRDTDSRSRKLGLQRLCHLYRHGRGLTNPYATRTVLLGLLYDESEKVRRWALNALALVGTARDAEAITSAIIRYRSQPDLLGAGVAALAAILKEEDLGTLLLRNELPLEGGLLLAAAQSTPEFDKKLVGMSLNIEKATPVDLRLGAILIGVGRAPDNLLSPTHSNKEMIGELNSHPDDLVAQYSVWATVENPLLSLADLKLAIRDVEAQPENVRGWIYRLVASSNNTASGHLDLLEAGSREGSVEAREGLAAGLRRATFEGVERLVVEWYLREESEVVKQRLLEHMAAKGHSLPRYKELVLSTYRAARTRSLIRNQLEAAAQGTSLYLDMKMIENDAERTDLFAAGASSPSSPARSSGETGVATQAEPFPSPDAVLVMVVTALPLEYAAILATLDRHRPVGVPGDPNVYALGVYSGGVGGRDRAVIVCQSAMGKVNASTTATHALRSFKQAEHLIMSGIAGGCPNPNLSAEHVRLGDVVISGDKGVLEYDFVKETEGGREIRSSAQKPARRLLNTAHDLVAKELLGDRPWEPLVEAASSKSDRFKRPPATADVMHDEAGEPVEHPQDDARREGQPRIHVAAIATADTLQKNPNARDLLRDKYGVRAIEMEASGMQNAAWATGKDIFVVRGICDYCDPHKNDDWQGYAAIVAAAFTRTIIEAMPEEWFPLPDGAKL